MTAKERPGGAAAEWRAYGFLPFVAGMGYSVTQLYAYALGPIIEPIQQEFGWTRAQVMSGVAIANVPGIVLLPLIAFSGPWAQGSIWTSATVSRFEKGRGLALAVTLSGGALPAIMDTSCLARSRCRC